MTLLGHKSLSQSKFFSDEGCTRKSFREYCALNTLFNGTLYRFRGESQWFTIARGSFATLLLVGIGVYAVQMLIIGPLDETGMLPVGSFRSLNLTENFPPMQDVSLNVVVVCYIFLDKLFF
jgi:hypothetical protein